MIFYDMHVHAISLSWSVLGGCSSFLLLNRTSCASKSGSVFFSFVMISLRLVAMIVLSLESEMPLYGI